MTEEKIKGNSAVEALFDVGAHIAYTKSRRHPSQKPYIFGVKNRTEIFDLEKTEDKLKMAEEFALSVGKSRGQMLVVGTKFEARAIVNKYAIEAGLPFVTERWIGGTLTNFAEIKKRVAHLEDLRMRRENNQLGMYTKKERLGFDKEIAKLSRFFEGIVGLKGMPATLFLIDPREEITAMNEARQLNIPVIALAGSDCDLKGVDCPVPANDASRKSIEYIVKRVIGAYNDGLAAAPEQVVKPVVGHKEETLAVSTSILGSAE